MSSVFSCGNCMKEYNLKNKKPLSLPCGHVFCEECVRSFVISSEIEKKFENFIKCPCDNKIHQAIVKTIPICYQILLNLPNLSINKSENLTKNIKNSCPLHQSFSCSICDHDQIENGNESESIKQLKMKNEYKYLNEIFDLESSNAKEIQEKFEKMEKCSNDYFNHQYSKVEIFFQRIVNSLKEKRKKINEELNDSEIECQNHFKKEKEKLEKKCEKLNVIKKEISKLENLVDNKKYNEFNEKRVIYLKEFKIISEIKINLSGIPYAYFSNTLKLDDTGETIKYFNSFDEIEQKYFVKKNSNHQIQNEIKHVNIKNLSKVNDSYNIFQDNLLNNKTYSTSPNKPQITFSSNNLKINKMESSLQASNFYIIIDSKIHANNSNDCNKNLVQNESKLQKNDKELDQLETMVISKKDNFQNIEIENEIACKIKLTKPENNVTKVNRKTSFPFTQIERSLQNNKSKHNTEQLFTSNSIAEKSFYNKNNVLLSNYMISSVNNPPFSVQKNSFSDKVVLSPSNDQLKTSGNKNENLNGKISSIHSEQSELNIARKKDIIIQTDKIVEFNLNSNNKILTIQSENSIDNCLSEQIQENKRSNSNKINFESKYLNNQTKESIRPEIKIKNGSSSNKTLKYLKKEENLKTNKKTSSSSKIKKNQE